MTSITILGIDPGFQTTGAVWLELNRTEKTYHHGAEALPGNDLQAIINFVDDNRSSRVPVSIFVEGYRIRGRVSRMDSWMMDFLSEIGHAIPDSQKIDNMGIKTVIPTDLMKAFDLWDTPIKTHHQDIRSAGRIALYGGVKDQYINENYLSPFMDDFLKGQPWVSA